jgi:hypothetical protein
MVLEATLGYYIRVLGTDPANIALDGLRTSAAPAVIDVDQGVGDAWQQLILKHSSGLEIAVIERNSRPIPVFANSRTAGSLKGSRPASPLWGSFALLILPDRGNLGRAFQY